MGPMRDVMQIHGGAPLHGEITVRGAKNFVSKAMVASLLGDGPSELHNVPRIRDVAVVRELLELHGVRVTLDEAAGVIALVGFRHTALSDRIEAASWASAALATRGDINVLGASQPEMTAFLNTYRKVGGGFEIHDKGIRFFHPGEDLRPIVLETDVHPGFMTDWQ